MKLQGKKIILDARDNDSQESFDRILKKFKKIIRNLNIIKEVKDRMYFEKPSSKLRRKREAAMRSRKKGRKK